MWIALSAYAGVGKDSLAEVLIEDHGFIKYAWADTLRLAAQALNPIVGVLLDEEVDASGTYLQQVGYNTVRIIRYNAALALEGYVEAKAMYPEFREVLQKLGTDVGRNLIHDNVWVDATIGRIEREGNTDANIVFTDTRFPNEAEAVRSRGGYVVRMERDDIGPVNDHPSETSLDDYDFDATVYNNGTLEMLPDLASHLLGILRNSA